MNAQILWKLNHRTSRLAGIVGAGIASEKRFAGWRGAMAAKRSLFMLEEIHQEIQPKIMALRECQEVLDSIGTRVNGGF